MTVVPFTGLELVRIRLNQANILPK